MARLLFIFLILVIALSTKRSWEKISILHLYTLNYNPCVIYFQSYVDMARFALTYPDNRRRRRRSVDRMYGPHYINAHDPHNAPFLLPGRKDHVHLHHGDHVGHEHGGGVGKNKSKTNNGKQSSRPVARRYFHEEL